MATWDGPAHGEGRSWNSSPRSKARAADNTKNVLCRNVTIYGYCRHEKDGCPYNHNPAKTNSHQSQHSSSSIKQRFNVDSPSFTPTIPGDAAGSKKAGFSPRAASAAPFTPKSTKASLASSSVQSRHQSSEWSNQEIPEFVPQGFHGGQLVGQADVAQSINVGDSFNPYDGTNSYGELDATSSAAHFNPYAHDPTTAAAAGAGGPTIYNQQNTFAQPLNHHLYAPSGPYRENLLAYQRTAHDFFISEDLRQTLQRNAEATLQALPNSSLPHNIEHFHSLVPLDTATQKNTAAFGYNTWLYKAQSSKDGYYYALRRIEGFRLTSEKAVRSVQAWKRIASASCVTIHDCFTTRAFGDSSLIFITDYHPSARTLHETHFPNQSAHRNVRPLSSSLIPEHVLWGYLVQLSSALKSIHSNGLAARLIHPTKVLVTGKNRLRLNANAVLDVVQPHPEGTPIQTLHHDDLAQLGRLMLALASSTPSPGVFVQSNVTVQRALEGLSRTYSQRLITVVASLLDAGNPSSPSAISDIATLSSQISDYALGSLDAALHAEDDVTGSLMRELENGRLARLVMKLGFINERPEYNPHEPSSASVNSGAASSTPTQAALQRGAWSETGDRFYLKLFRDFVFHQVSGADGRPVVDLAHAIACLNKVDAGSEERIALVSRDEQSVIVVSYREVKRGIERAFAELRQAGNATGQSGSWR